MLKSVLFCHMIRGFYEYNIIQYPVAISNCYTILYQSVDYMLY